MPDLPESSAQSVRPVVLFDFDNTIVRGDSFLRFVLDLLRREPSRLPATLASASLVGPWALHPLTVSPAITAMLWTATWGLDRVALDARQRAFVERRASSGPWLYEAAREAIEQQRARGARIVVVTGCEQTLAEHICQRLALGTLEVVGSRIERKRGGFVCSVHCHHERKVACLAERGIAPPWDHVFSDSLRDLPLMRHAARVTLVNPSARTARALQATRAAVEIARWR
jgi:phosphatidylglycerophosphatase C